MCAAVAPSAEYLRGHGRVAVNVTALRRLWQHSPVLYTPCCSRLRASLICCPAWQLVVVAVCQLLIKTIIIIITKCRGRIHVADCSSADNGDRSAQ